MPFCSASSTRGSHPELRSTQRIPSGRAGKKANGAICWGRSQVSYGIRAESPSKSFHWPSRVIPIKIRRYFAGFSPRITVAAERRETSYSENRPPNSRASRIGWEINIGTRPLFSFKISGTPGPHQSPNTEIQNDYTTVGSFFQGIFPHPTRLSHFSTIEKETGKPIRPSFPKAAFFSFFKGKRKIQAAPKHSGLSNLCRKAEKNPLFPPFGSLALPERICYTVRDFKCLSISDKNGLFSYRERP